MAKMLMCVAFADEDSTDYTPINVDMTLIRVPYFTDDINYDHHTLLCRASSNISVNCHGILFIQLRQSTTTTTTTAFISY